MKLRSGRFLRGAPLGLLGMFLAVLAIESGLRRAHVHLTELAAASWEYSHRKAEKIGRSADVLCFGSSLLKFGVIPARIEQRIGRPTFNLAVYSGRMASTYYLLRRSLDAGARPAAIVLDNIIDTHPRNAASQENTAISSNLRNWPEILRSSEIVDLAWQAGDADFLASSLLSRYLFSYRARHEIRSAVTEQIQGVARSNGANIAFLLRNWNANLGTQILPAKATAETSTPPANPLATNPPQVAANQLVANPLTEKYTRRVLDLTAARGIPVFMVIPPLRRDAKATQDLGGITAFTREFNRRLIAQYPHLQILDASDAPYPDHVFYDNVHLNIDGASAFSDDLGAALADRLNSPPAMGDRICRLPAYQERRDRGPFESFDQSVLAVKTGRLSR